MKNGVWDVILEIENEEQEHTYQSEYCVLASSAEDASRAAKRMASKELEAGYTQKVISLERVRVLTC